MREAWNISSSLCSDDQHHYFPRLPLQSPVLWHVSHACGHGECESSLLEQPHEQQVKATAQGERICVLPSFLTDLQHFTSVVCLPLPVMDLDWLYFPCLFPHLLPISICWLLFLYNKSLDHLLARLHSPYTVETRPKAGACGNCCNTIKGW